MTDPIRDHDRTADLFADIRPPGQDELQVLHLRLEVTAEAKGLLDVAYRTVDTPVGTLLLAATPAGLVRVAYEREGLDGVLEGLARQLSPRILSAPQRTDAAARQLEEYFAGDRNRFDLPLDLSLSRGFRRTVLSYLPRIGYGKTASYGEVAAAVHNPKAVRAVGTACATNPLPLIVPCHRVIRTDGLIGSYLAGPEVKQQLLDLEAGA
ncbi:MAG TPA: methylated-DNA--[protein]-cysteine S-methyltransferase [Acidimicrobiales bacterium]|jgi:methylated-DNA-[protein]-cysteine S-methyltransferase|nr:methylated-DNA--[protein]-cysteine S-methyltransferase [Acidimicrobiales bacterium]